LKEHSFI